MNLHMRAGALIVLAFSAVIAVSSLATDEAAAQRGGDGPAPPATLKELCDLSQLIVETTVQSVFPAFETGQSPATLLFTDYMFTVNRVVKGSSPGSQIVVGQLGGVLGERKFVDPQLPPMVTGQRYILFLRGYSPQTWPVRGVPRFAGVHASSPILLDGEKIQLRAESKFRNSPLATMSPTQLISEIQTLLGK